MRIQSKKLTKEMNKSTAYGLILKVIDQYGYEMVETLIEIAKEDIRKYETINIEKFAR